MFQMQDKRPQILVTNDDGYQAKGLHKLAELMCKVGEVTVISTERVMSAQGHSITTQHPLRVKPIERAGAYRVFVCNGTPVDCVKLGYQKVMHVRPDLVVSGINHGSNASVNVIYSGTMAAVIEARMNGIPAVGFSLDCYDADADFDHLDDYIVGITRRTLEEGLPAGVCLNVNFPKRSETSIKGVRICRQAKARWAELFEDHYDENGEPYYNLGGEFVYQDEGDDTDIVALQDNYVSIVPTGFDWTVHDCMTAMHDFTHLCLKAVR